ncbi:MAG: nucleotidyltransferase [Bacteriovoracia bacterium]
MPNTPSINPTQVSARNTEGGARFNLALFSTLDALEEAQIPFALIGGVAASGLGRPRSTHDIDIFVRPEDAESAVQALAAKGFRTERTDIEWLFKAFKEDILVDIVFRSKGDIYFDDEMHRNRKLVEFHGRKVPLVSPEDLVIIKCAVHYEGGPHHWHDALAILSHATIDWNYLLKRARRAPRRLLALLLYAQSSDILIPNSMIVNLFHHIFVDDGKIGNQNLPPLEKPRTISAEKSKLHPAASPVPENNSPDYLLAHIRQALAEDGRTAQQDLKILLDGNRLVVKGECPSEARCKAVVDVIRSVAPGLEISNQIQLTHNEAPERAEVIS